MASVYPDVYTRIKISPSQICQPCLPAKLLFLQTSLLVKPVYLSTCQTIKFDNLYFQQLPCQDFRLNFAVPLAAEAVSIAARLLNPTTSIWQLVCQSVLTTQRYSLPS